MNYASAQAVTSPTVQRPMDKIALAADRVERAAHRLGIILDRFHGPSPQPSSGPDGSLTVSYVSGLDRLLANIERVENAIEGLDQVA